MLPASEMTPGRKVRIEVSIEGRDDRKSTRLVEAPFVGPGH